MNTHTRPTGLTEFEPSQGSGDEDPRPGDGTAPAQELKALPRFSGPAPSSGDGKRIPALDSAALGEWGWDIADGTMWLSARAAELHGCAARSLPSTFESWRELIAPEDQPSVMRVLKDAVESQRTFCIDFRVRTDGPSVRWTERGGPLEAPGESPRMAGICADASERHSAADEHGDKLADERRSRLEVAAARDRAINVLEAIGDAIVCADSEWRVSYLNPEAGRLLGVVRASVVGAVLWDKLTWPDVERLREECEWALSEEAVARLDRLMIGDKKYELRGYPANGGLTLHLRDVTHRG